MTDIKLSKRMETFAHMVDEERVADIGCDHAFVSMYLIKTGRAKKVIAMDVKKGPLHIARDNINSHCMGDIIETRLSNGFDKLSVGEVDCAIIAGMGGELMVDIMTRGKVHTDNGIHLILQPQSEPWKVREYLYNIGYEITDEEILIEEGKYYVVIKAIPAKEYINPYNKQELVYGRILIESKHPILISYIEHNISKNQELYTKLQHIHTEKSSDRMKDLEEELIFERSVLYAVSGHN